MVEAWLLYRLRTDVGGRLTAGDLKGTALEASRWQPVATDVPWLWEGAGALSFERELANLRRKGERTAAQLDRLQQDHARQGAVLKRKNEEVIALHKRGQHGRRGHREWKASHLPQVDRFCE